MKTISIIIKMSDGSENELWSYAPQLDVWESGQTLIPKAVNFQVTKVWIVRQIFE